MSRIRVAITIEAPPRVVWREIEDLASHVEWMHDAVAIRFTSSSRRGVGTTFECDTRVGPITLVDQMEITSWRPRREMGVRHTGIVSGSGTFRLRRRGRGSTRFIWREQLSFPWWAGGPFGAVIAAEVLRGIWRRNLRNLKARVEARAVSR
jgi:uncharacterized protein YndB with AHSA1/START domain